MAFWQSWYCVYPEMCPAWQHYRVQSTTDNKLHWMQILPFIIHLTPDSLLPYPIKLLPDGPLWSRLPISIFAAPFASEVSHALIILKDISSGVCELICILDPGRLQLLHFLPCNLERGLIGCITIRFRAEALLMCFLQWIFRTLVC